MVALPKKTSISPLIRNIVHIIRNLLYSQIAVLGVYYTYTLEQEDCSSEKRRRFS